MAENIDKQQLIETICEHCVVNSSCGNKYKGRCYTVISALTEKSERMAAEYIDRNKVFETLADWVSSGELFNSNAMYYLKARIWDIPAADVRENIKGKWGVYNSPFTDTLCCSVCGFNILPELGDYNFCPDCGADMRKTCDDQERLNNERLDRE